MKKNIELKISLLDWGIIIACIVMISVIYVPRSIWMEEQEIRDESRRRMSIIWEAEEYYRQLTGSYTTDGTRLFDLVQAAMDSLIADSLFIGEQIIHLDGEAVSVELEKGFEVMVDTTFSVKVETKKLVKDTTYMIGFTNELTQGVDTLYVGSRELAKAKEDPSFLQVFSSDTGSHYEIISDYLRKKYHLTEPLLYCPLIGEPYVLEIDSSDEENPIFKVTSPVPEDYTERRFGVFKFEAGRHGSIEGGRTSWAVN